MIDKSVLSLFVIFVSYMFLPTAARANNPNRFENRYQCRSIQGVTPRVSINIVEAYEIRGSESVLLSATETLVIEGTEPRTFPVSVMSISPSPGRTQVSWRGEGTEVRGFFAANDPRRNFTGNYIERDGANPIVLSCVF